MRGARRRAPLETPRVGRLQGADPQRLGGYEELGRSMGWRDHGSTFSQGVCELSFLGTSGHRRDGVRGARDGARIARRDGGRRARYGGLSAVALALLIAGCDGRRTKLVQAAPAPPPPEISFTSIESPSLQFLPRREEAPGWRLEEDPIVIPANRLQAYLDQDSSHFARYETIDLTVGKYTATAGSGFATVEIFRFPDFVKAFGAY